MVFRQGDNVLIPIGKAGYIRLSLEDRIKLMGIVLDREEKNALSYLYEIIYPRIHESIGKGEVPMSLEVQELERMLEDGDSHAALKYITDVLYKRVLAYMNRPACKPAFELPKGEDLARTQHSAIQAYEKKSSGS